MPPPMMATSRGRWLVEFFFLPDDWLLPEARPLPRVDACLDFNDAAERDRAGAALRRRRGFFSMGAYLPAILGLGEELCQRNQRGRARCLAELGSRGRPYYAATG